MDRFSDAELASRIKGLGLSFNEFARVFDRDAGIETIDERAVHAQIGGARVTPKVMTKVRALEARFDADVARFIRATEDGIPIEIPRSNEPARGFMPPGYWHLVAAACIRACGDDAQIEYPPRER